MAIHSLDIIKLVIVTIIIIIANDLGQLDIDQLILILTLSPIFFHFLHFLLLLVTLSFILPITIIFSLFFSCLLNHQRDLRLNFCINNGSLSMLPYVPIYTLDQLDNQLDEVSRKSDNVDLVYLLLVHMSILFIFRYTTLSSA